MVDAGTVIPEILEEGLTYGANLDEVLADVAKLNMDAYRRTLAEPATPAHSQAASEASPLAARSSKGEVAHSVAFCSDECVETRNITVVKMSGEIAFGPCELRVDLTVRQLKLRFDPHQPKVLSCGHAILPDNVTFVNAPREVLLSVNYSVPEAQQDAFLSSSPCDRAVNVLLLASYRIVGESKYGLEAVHNILGCPVTVKRITGDGYGTHTAHSNAFPEL